MVNPKPVFESSVNYINMMCFHIGLLDNSSANVFFTLNTEITEDPPLFSITCNTQGGPATFVKWTENHLDISSMNENRSQVIVDTSHNCIYESIFHIRGRRRGKTYYCTINSNIRTFLPLTKPRVVHKNISIKGIVNEYILIGLDIFCYSCRRAHQSYCSHL